MYNLASLQSLEALKEKRAGTEDGLKRAMGLFSSSAGIYQFLIDHPEMMRAPMSSMNVDVTADALALASQLMVAQAQAVFFEKAATAGTSPTLTAKLAAGTAKLFKLTQASAYVSILSQLLLEGS